MKSFGVSDEVLLEFVIVDECDELWRRLSAGDWAESMRIPSKSLGSYINGIFSFSRQCFVTCLAFTNNRNFCSNSIERKT